MFIEPADLSPFVDLDPAKAAAMIADAEAMAITAAPCLGGSLTPQQQAAVKAVLRGALIRWAESGGGAVVTQQAGPFSQTVDNRQPRRTLFWPSEIAELQGICGSGKAAAFAVDTAPQCGPHLAWCSVTWGALYCSCGVDIAGKPIFELGG